MDGLGRPATVPESRRLGRAAVLVMLRVARHCPSAVLDGTWFDYTVPLLRRLPGPLVEVHCAVPVELARQRYLARAGHRHAGHLDDQRTEDELWGTRYRPLGLGPAIEVDTSVPVDVPLLAMRIRSNSGGLSH